MDNIPPAFRAHHEFCFRLHDAMVLLVKEAEASRAADRAVEFAGPDEAAAFAALDVDILTWLVRSERRADAMRITLNQVSLALFSDLLHFLFEALRALERRKFTVAIALLRKPLKENLMFATWMCADEEDFFDRMLRSPADHLETRNLSPERRAELLRVAVSRVDRLRRLDPARLNGLLFDKASPGGLAAAFDQATHLVTSRSRIMRTAELNLNSSFATRKNRMSTRPSTNL